MIGRTDNVTLVIVFTFGPLILNSWWLKQTQVVY